MLKTEARRLLIEKRGNKCERCGLTEWLGQPIKLEVHHLDGNRQNDKEENLLVLCPNCHSFTENYSKNTKQNSIDEENLVAILKDSSSIHQALLKAGLSTAGANYKRARELVQKYELSHLYDKSELYTKTKVEDTINFCVDCGVQIQANSTRCVKCNAIYSRLANRPSREELKQLIRTTPFTVIGKKFGVTDNAIRKWCDSYGLPRRVSEIKKYSDEEWQQL